MGHRVPDHLVAGAVQDGLSGAAGPPRLDGGDAADELAIRRRCDGATARQVRQVQATDSRRGEPQGDGCRWPAW